ncbi:lipoprotein [Planotetraspora thailandica]|uniref:Lipoprotein n=1 Tax=Planotetraspora thailandica TaxID=487172 RepID=A0A8J3UYI2_9ACTN|nr:DUF4232 domain-containing protein [Planotetraspora thailandica]GII53246.1 lipoprotein [Planotetraspora thailandica]
MRITALSLPAVLVGVLLLSACGSERAATRSDGSQQTQGSDSADRRGDPSCGAPSTGTPPTSGTSELPGGSADLEKDGVKITGLNGRSRNCDRYPLSAEFRVTNHESEPFTYTITFEFLSDSGEALAYTEQTVPSVRPGQTVKRTVDMSELHSPAPVAVRVGIAEVRSVPADEAPAPTGPCPASGTRVTTDDGDAAMGLRVVGVHLENCSTRAYRINGYPKLQLLDEDRKPVTGVEVLHGSGGISTVTGFDDPPKPVTLQPGQSASAGLMWRNTVTDGAPVNVPYVRVNAKAGARPVMVTPELDLGTTGKLGVSPWKKDEVP